MQLLVKEDTSDTSSLVWREIGVESVGFRGLNTVFVQDSDIKEKTVVLSYGLILQSFSAHITLRWFLPLQWFHRHLLLILL